ncbi:MAG TPA: protein-disulfide reductase DsbD domain-containing protein, partial [Candidatus Krumholzibacteria bacterium]|nr:protein-disulfide reductase DsbD domain-containing protein [Candidatus Krumholzibacteria bacterium]
MKKRLIAALLVVTATVAGLSRPSPAIDFVDPTAGPVTATGYASLSNLPQGGSAHLALEVQIRAPWHVNAHNVTEDYLVPTDVAFELPPGVTLRGVVFPAGTEKTLSFSEAPLRLYDGTVYLGAAIDVAADAPAGETAVIARITYQACDNEKCLLPETIETRIPVRISTAREAVDLAH